jgi:hypothetical protein
MILTPLPGTRLWDEMSADARIAADRFPNDWQYCTGIPVAGHKHLSWPQLRSEMEECWRTFYSSGRIAARLWEAARQRRNPLAMLIGSISYRMNYRAETRQARLLDLARVPRMLGKLIPVLAPCAPAPAV